MNFNEGKADKRPTAKPSHDDIKDEILKFDEKIIKYIEMVYFNEEIKYDEEFNKYASKFNSKYPLELILKILKWMFIEQDIRYWNYSGRSELYAYLIKSWKEENT